MIGSLELFLRLVAVLKREILCVDYVQVSSNAWIILFQHDRKNLLIFELTSNF